MLLACSCFFQVAAAGQGTKKPTTVSSRGFLSKSNLATTSADGVVYYNDDCQDDLSITL
jgi:hypothetical protein